MNFLKKFLTVFFLFAIHLTYSFTCKITVWHRINAQTGKPQVVVVCHDFHNMSPALNNNQVAYWQQNIQSYQEHEFFFENSTDAAALELVKKQGLQPLIDEVIGIAQQANISPQTIEFRHKQLIARGLCVHAINFTTENQFQQFETNLNNMNIYFPKAADIAHECTHSIATLKKQLSCAIENNCISAELASELTQLIDTITQNAQEKMSSLAASDLDILTYMRKNNCLHTEFLNWLLLYNIQLLEVKALLSLLTLEKRAVVFLGSAHAAKLEYYLQEAGYELIRTAGTEIKLTDQFAIPAHLLGNQGLIESYIATTPELKRYPTGELLKPISSYTIHTLCAYPTHTQWWQRAALYISWHAQYGLKLVKII